MLHWKWIGLNMTGWNPESEEEVELESKEEDEEEREQEEDGEEGDIFKKMGGKEKVKRRER